MRIPEQELKPSSSTLDGAFFCLVDVDEADEESREVFISELGDIPPPAPLGAAP